MAACLTLSKGRLIACKTGSAGIKAVSFAVYDREIVIPALEGEITSLSGITAAYTYDTNNDGSNYVETIASDKQTRSTLFTGALNLVLPKIDTDTRNEVLMLTKGLVWAFIEDYNGNVYLIGKDTGADLIGGTIATGGARTDLQGYTLNFQTMEVEPLMKLSDAALAEYKAIQVFGT